MKAGIGILLVFTGLTLGYLVLSGKLPMPVPPDSTTLSTSSTVHGVTTSTSSTVQGVTTSTETYNPLPGLGHQAGGGLVASVPDTYVQGQIKAGRYAL